MDHELAVLARIHTGTFVGERGSSAGGQSGAELSEGINCILSRLPANLEVPRDINNTSAFAACLRQETLALNSVLTRVRADLEATLHMLAGNGAQTTAMAALQTALAARAVPSSWASSTWSAPNLAAWESGLRTRHVQLLRWAQGSRPPCPLWLGGLFNPAGLLTAVRQEAVRRHSADQWSLEDVILSVSVTKADASGVRDLHGEGLFIAGLQLEGAGWSRRHDALVEAEPGRAAMPVVQITAVLRSEKQQGSGHYETPCYKSSARGQAGFVAMLPLRTTVDPAHWVIRGVALICGGSGAY